MVKKELIGRIIDGETFGQLPKCPNCSFGQLRLHSTNPDIVICPGYVSVIGKNKVSAQCGYQELATCQVRSKRWFGRRYFTKHVSEMEEFQPALKN